MVINKNLDWKGTLFRSFIYIIGIPLSALVLFLCGFIVVGVVWIIPNILFGTLDWIVTGVYNLIFEWTIIWTRVSMVIGTIIVFLTLGHMLDRC